MMKKIIPISFLLASLLLSVVVAYDPYWMGHKWFPYQVPYTISSSVPANFHDDIDWAFAKWNEPSPLTFYRGEGYWNGGFIKFGWPGEWFDAYTEVYYSGNEMSHFISTFKDTIQWTDDPCWYFWNTNRRIGSVALHEFGHGIDFKSVNDTDTVLYRYYRCYTGIFSRDWSAVDELY